MFMISATVNYNYSNLYILEFPLEHSRASAFFTEHVFSSRATILSGNTYQTLN